MCYGNIYHPSSNTLIPIHGAAEKGAYVVRCSVFVWIPIQHISPVTSHQGFIQDLGLRMGKV